MEQYKKNSFSIKLDLYEKVMPCTNIIHYSEAKKQFYENLNQTIFGSNNNCNHINEKLDAESIENYIDSNH